MTDWGQKRERARRMVHRFGLDAVLRAREPGDAADLDKWMQVARGEMLEMCVPGH